MQKLLENLQDPNQVKLLMKALHRGATTLAMDLNGHHVIQYCLVHFHTDINMVMCFRVFGLLILFDVHLLCKNVVECILGFTK